MIWDTIRAENLGRYNNASGESLATERSAPTSAISAEHLRKFCQRTCCSVLRDVLESREDIVFQTGWSLTLLTLSA